LHHAGNSPPLPGQRSAGPVEASQGRFSPSWRAAWGSWLGISVLFFGIWLISGASGGLWFLWVPALMGVLLLGAGSAAHLPTATAGRAGRGGTTATATRHRSYRGGERPPQTPTERLCRMADVGSGPRG